MSLRNQIHFIIYRIREQGLEVFLLSRDRDNSLQIPKGNLDNSNQKSLVEDDNLIELDSIDANESLHACAIEGDWHDIPSLKGMLIDDIKEAKDKLEEKILPELEKGTFVAVKDALKKVMPEQYSFLKELKDIISDRNSITGI